MLFDLDDGRVLGVDVHGPEDAPAVVLLHGLSASRHEFGTVVAHLVRRGFAAVTIDLRGHGESSWAASYAAVEHAADVDAVLERLGIGPVVLVGHSLGGVTAAALAIRHPEAVRAVFLEDPPLFEGDPTVRAASPTASRFAGIVATVRRLRAEQAPSSAYAVVAGDVTGAADLARRCESLSRWDPESMQAALDGVVWEGFDPTVELPVPVLVIAADPDRGSAFAPEHERRFLAVNLHARVIRVPGAGHRVRAEPTTEAYLSHLDAFLSVVGPVRGQAPSA